MKVFQNAIYIPSKDLYIISKNTHDYVTYTHDDGREVFIDGGPSYLRGGGDFSLYRDGIVEKFHITDEDMEGITNISEADVLTHRALWGSRGKKGDKPMTFKPIRTFTRDHLRNVKKNCASYMNPILLGVVKYWLRVKYNE